MIRINLLPIKQLQAEVARRREIIIGSVVLGCALLFLIVTHFYQSYQINEREREIAALRIELQALNAKVKEVADLQVKIKELRGKQKIIEDLNHKKSGPVLVMTSLSAATPASLWLTDLREGGGGVTMNGMATDHETLAGFMRSLEASKHFSNIELIETIQGAGPTGTLKKFAIKARVNYRAPAIQPADKNKPAPPVQKEEKKS
jgi:type IV pilus assembly protein PilN